MLNFHQNYLPILWGYLNLLDFHLLCLLVANTIMQNKLYKYFDYHFIFIIKNHFTYVTKNK